MPKSLKPVVSGSAVDGYERGGEEAARKVGEHPKSQAAEVQAPLRHALREGAPCVSNEPEGGR